MILWLIPFIASLVLIGILITLSKTREEDMLILTMKDIEKKIERLERESLEALLGEGEDSVYEKLKGRCVC